MSSPPLEYIAAIEAQQRARQVHAAEQVRRQRRQRHIELSNNLLLMEEPSVEIVIERRTVEARDFTTPQELAVEGDFSRAVSIVAAVRLRSTARRVAAADGARNPGVQIALGDGVDGSHWWQLEDTTGLYASVLMHPPDIETEFTNVTRRFVQPLAPHLVVWATPGWFLDDGRVVSRPEPVTIEVFAVDLVVRSLGGLG